MRTLHKTLIGLFTVIFAAHALAGKAPAQAPETSITIIHAGELLAVPGQQPLSQQSIIIENDRIREVRSGFVAPTDIGIGVQVIDLSSSFVMPGFIDSHVHLTGDGAKFDDIHDPIYTEHAFMTDAEYALRAVKPAQRSLRQGFTTLRNAGTHGSFAIRDLRDAINAGHIDGPRILSAISVVEVPGGFDDFSVGLRDELLDLRKPPGVCSNLGECQTAVRQLFKLGADFIKIDNESMNIHQPHKRVRNSLPNFTDEELQAIVDASHRLGLKASVHAIGGTIEQALQAGADSIEHGWDMDAAAVKLFKKSKSTYLVPTWTSFMHLVDAARDPNSKLHPMAKAGILRSYELTKKGHSMALKDGVKFAFGSDSGPVKHGENLKEFLYLKDIGMTPMQAIQSATIHAADLAGLSRETGTIEPGKSADIIAVANNPLDNMENLLDMRFVMARGRVFRQD